MVIPWKQTLATKCTVTYDKSGWVLQDHVIQSFLGTSSSTSLDKCEENPSCHSINWFRYTGVCQLNNGTHLAYPLAPSSSGSYMLYSLRPMIDISLAACTKKFCTPGDSCKIIEGGFGHRCEECVVKALGMHDRRIKDQQIKASSAIGYLLPHYGRLNYHRSSWGATKNTVGQSLWIDLGRVYSVRKVATQSRHEDRQWVTKYSLQYSQDGISWKDVKDEKNGAKKIFNGNNKQHEIVYNNLPSPVQTKFIKFVVMAWHSHISMRVEVYGCLIP